MSIIVKFFMAPDDASAGLALQTGPGRARESLSFGNFDPEEAVVEWECLLTGGSFEELVDAGEPHIVAGQDSGGCVVFSISPRLSAAFAPAPRFAGPRCCVGCAARCGRRSHRSGDRRRDGV